MYNKPVKVNFTKNFQKVFSINCISKIPVPPFKETTSVKELKVSSALLSSFYKRATTIDAAIILLAGYYNEPYRLFPVVFEISGYGGDYHSYSGIQLDSFPCIAVFLDGNCLTGHSTYDNSMNNEPWGDALVTEMTPFLEKKLRCNDARFLTGHSSGG